MKRYLPILIALLLPVSVFASTGQGWLYSPTAAGNSSIASGSPTVNYITATSTTATSTFGYGINVSQGCVAVNGVCITSGGGGGITSITASSPLTGGTITTSGSIGCQTASGSQAGCLSSADWSTFNGKGSGNVNAAGAGQVAYYSSSGTAVSGTTTAYINPDGSFGVYRGTRAVGDVGQNITGLVTSGIFTALDIRNNLSGGGGGSGAAINISNIGTSTSLIPQAQLRCSDDGDFSENCAILLKAQGSFTNALQTVLNVKSNNCVIGNASGLTIQNVTGGDQINDINTTSACSVKQLMIDGSQGQASMYYAVNAGTGTAVQVPFNFSSGVGSFGAIPSQVLGNGGSPLHNSEFNFNSTPGTMKTAGDSSVAVTNYSGSALNSGSSFCANSVALLNGFNATTTREGSDNSDCLIWVPNFAVLSDDAANAGIIVNSSKQYMNGFVFGGPGGSSNSGLDAENYATLYLNFLNGKLEVPKWQLDIPTPFDAMYQFTVSGITTSPSNQAMYNVNGISGAGGTNFEESAESITGGTGTINMTGTTTPPSSGTLTLDSQTGTGDATISYSAVTIINQWQDALSVSPVTGSTTIKSLLVLSSSTTAVPFMVATSSVGTAGILQYTDAEGNEYSAGPLPVLSACGTSPALASGSNNNAGRIVIGSGIGTASCTMTFADLGWTSTSNAPYCFADVEGGLTFAINSNPTQTSVVFAATTGTFPSDTFSYHCGGF